MCSHWILIALNLVEYAVKLSSLCHFRVFFLARMSIHNCCEAVLWQRLWLKCDLEIKINVNKKFLKYVRAVQLKYSLPLYLGTQRTVEGRPLMLKCLPSNWEHCSSLKSLRPFGHGSVLQERNFMRRPTQKRPPFLGLLRTHTWMRVVMSCNRSYEIKNNFVKSKRATLA